MQSKAGFWPLGRPTAQLYAEYRDEVDKFNKKQDILLSKHMKVINRQERVANSFLKKNRHEIEQLKSNIRDMEARSMDLHEYDSFKYILKASKITNGKEQGYQTTQNNNFSKSSSYNSSPRAGMNMSHDSTPRSEGVRLPPLWHGQEQDSPRNQSRIQNGCETKALSIRAMKRNTLRHLPSHDSHNCLDLSPTGRSQKQVWWSNRATDEEHYFDRLEKQSPRIEELQQLGSQTDRGHYGHQSRSTLKRGKVMMYGSLDSVHEICVEADQEKRRSNSKHKVNDNRTILEEEVESIKKTQDKQSNAFDNEKAEDNSSDFNKVQLPISSSRNSNFNTQREVDLNNGIGLEENRNDSPSEIKDLEEIKDNKYESNETNTKYLYSESIDNETKRASSQNSLNFLVTNHQSNQGDSVNNNETSSPRRRKKKHKHQHRNITDDVKNKTPTVEIIICSHHRHKNKDAEKVAQSQNCSNQKSTAANHEARLSPRKRKVLQEELHRNSLSVVNSWRVVKDESENLNGGQSPLTVTGYNS